MVHGGLLRGGLADEVGAAGVGCTGIGHGGGVTIAFVLDNFAGESVYVVFVLGVAGVEVHLVYHDAVVAVEIDVTVTEGVHIYAGVSAGGFERGLGADVGTFTGGARLGDAAVAYAAGGGY